MRALQAYRKAASLVDAADATCHIDWALLAAIERVESNHARFGGNQLDSSGVAQPGIIGIALDGRNGIARIMDSERGTLDRDTVYDRAVSPMHFIPSTWRVVGVDADGDGAKNPQDMADAATSTGIYLCSGPGDLNRPSDLRAAVMRYNASDSYVRTVTAIAEAYRHGVRALPASDLPAATSGPTTPDAAQAAPVPAVPVKKVPVPAEPVKTAPIPAVPAAPSAPVPTAPDACLPVSAVPDPSVSDPSVPDPALPVPALPVPALPAEPVPPKTDPTLTVSEVPLQALTVPLSTPAVGIEHSAPLAQEICTVVRRKAGE